MALIKTLQNFLKALFQQPADFFYQQEQRQFERRMEAIRVSAQPMNPQYWQQAQQRRYRGE